jgi:hypothetical protein
VDAKELLEHVERRAVEASSVTKELEELRAYYKSVMDHIPRIVELVRPTPEFQAAQSSQTSRELFQIVGDVLERLSRQDADAQKKQQKRRRGQGQQPADRNGALPER